MLHTSCAWLRRACAARAGSGCALCSASCREHRRYPALIVGRSFMPWDCRRLRAVAAAVLLLGWGSQASAALVRFHYVPADACGNTTLSSRCGSVGERVRWLGAIREPSPYEPRPTHLVTFWHPYTRRC